MNHDELIRNDCHPWCRCTARDEAVRAAEDGRSVPLPTLAEAICSARAMISKSVSGSSAPEQENKGNCITTNHDAPPGARVSERPCAGHADTGADTAGAGLRTERVTLEITHDCAYQAAEWLLEIAQESCSDPGESVRVVEETAG